MRTAVVFCAVILLRPDVSAPQDPESSAPAFEVASVKLNRSGDTRWFGSAAGQSQFVRLTNWPVSRIIAHAYGIDPGFEQFKLAGGPGSILSATFDINAKRPDGVPAGQNFAMLRTLLADRFGLKIRAETRQTPLLALTLAREGRLGLDRPLVDATGVTGSVAWQLTFAVMDNPDVPRISTALEEQLGLKLQPRTGPFEVFFIESIAMPTPD